MESKIDNAGILLQEITDYAKNNVGFTEKIRFPRRYIRTVSDFGKDLTFVAENNLRKNIIYVFILIDVFRWLFNHTDIKGTAREMLLKNCIMLYGSICESMITAAMKTIISGNRKFKEKTKRMVTKGIISPDLKERLDWLWNKRVDAAHIYLVDTLEYGKYDCRDYYKAKKATDDLIEALRKFI